MKEMNQKTPRKCFNFRGRERNRVLSGVWVGVWVSVRLRSPSIAFYIYFMDEPITTPRPRL